VEDENAASIAGQRGLFVVNGSSCRLALLGDRTDRRRLGEEPAAPLIDKLHHAMHLWKEEKRGELVEHLAQHDLMDEPAFWKLTQALFEVLPRGEEDWRIISALLGERETLKMPLRLAWKLICLVMDYRYFVSVIDLVRTGGRIVDFKTTARKPDVELLTHTSETQTTSYGLLYRIQARCRRGHRPRLQPRLLLQYFGLQRQSDGLAFGRLAFRF
jgi:hypothetical protein